nr:isoform 2 of ankyrin repeat and socs box protein 2 [Quercus suber]
MAESTVADLKPFPAVYHSSRALFDVLVGEDAALPLIEACSSSEDAALQSMLSQPHWTKIAWEAPHCIYSEDRPSDDGQLIRGVSAMPMSNVERTMIIAAKDGHAAAVSTLLAFTSQHGREYSSVISRWAVMRAIRNGHAAVFEALASADPTVANFHLSHEGAPLDLAVRNRQTEVVAVLLRFGADPTRPMPPIHTKRYGSSLLSFAVRAKDLRTAEVLLQHGVPVARSGALQYASTHGALDAISLLLQHGADVNERLPADAIMISNQPLHASWTPLHFAAEGNQIEAKCRQSTPSAMARPCCLSRSEQRIFARPKCYCSMGSPSLVLAHYNTPRLTALSTPSPFCCSTVPT